MEGRHGEVEVSSETGELVEEGDGRARGLQGWEAVYGS